MPIITVAGARRDASFQQARVLAEDLCKKVKGIILKVEEMHEMKWVTYIEEKKKEVSGAAHSHATECIVLHSVEGYIGGAKEFLEWTKELYEMEPRLDTKASEAEAQKRFEEYKKSSGNAFCFVDLKFGEGKETSRLVFELDMKLCPKTSQNFLALCTGDKKEKGEDGSTLHYKGSPIHRIVPGGWVQGGDINSGKGNGGSSIYGKVFGDECFTIKHDRRGVLAMANVGPHTNSSQFYITFKSLPYLDKKKVAFGHVIEGSDVLAKLEAAQCKNQRPVQPIIVTECGKL
eukprot:CAMPEP_0184485410 /NCGR_PEP_ID=MMETSP0113_2-20130426/7024_1 /TAXON_ID=91329 /ORGANISM="Norrisiella sphaerica, Strain BC52" /LENGTH=288 /DNA_ID=CAMNT_0026866843 /DNA_START=99 /DNA_END=965 /DNA_ORIENTATION=-